MTTDAAFMRHALALARRGLGLTAPNPSVGCVVVKDGRVVGRGWTQPGGRPHAEPQALALAGDHTRGSTVYVTLEPCAHQGQTGPCARALIDAGVSRVVSALEDPDPRVAGKGHAMLRAAGVAVEIGVEAAEARAVNAGFLKRLDTGLPYVTVKVASSLDGRTALENGDSQWITGPGARAAGHMLRATHDAILTGIGTVLADDPQLDCRLPGMAARSPVRFVADRGGRLPPTARLLQKPPGGTVYLLSAAGGAVAGATVLSPPCDPDGRLNVRGLLRAIGARGITRLLVEAGPGLTTAIVQADAADQIIWFHGGKILGGDARAAIGALSLSDLATAPEYRRTACVRWGEDAMETFERRA